MNKEIPNKHVQKMINDAIKGINIKYSSSENEFFNELGLNKSNEEVIKNSEDEIFKSFKPVNDNWNKYDFIEEVKQICNHKDLTIDQKIFSIKMIAQKAPKTKYDKKANNG